MRILHDQAGDMTWIGHAGKFNPRSKVSRVFTGTWKRGRSSCLEVSTVRNFEPKPLVPNRGQRLRNRLTRVQIGIVNQFPTVRLWYVIFTNRICSKIKIHIIMLIDIWKFEFLGGNTVGFPVWTCQTIWTAVQIIFSPVFHIPNSKWDGPDNFFLYPPTTLQIRLLFVKFFQFSSPKKDLKKRRFESEPANCESDWIRTGGSENHKLPVRRSGSKPKLEILTVRASLLLSHKKNVRCLIRK